MKTVVAALMFVCCLAIASCGRLMQKDLKSQAMECYNKYALGTACIFNDNLEMCVRKIEPVNEADLTFLQDYLVAIKNGKRVCQANMEMAEAMDCFNKYSKGRTCIYNEEYRACLLELNPVTPAGREFVDVELSYIRQGIDKCPMGQ